MDCNNREVGWIESYIREEMQVRKAKEGQPLLQQEWRSAYASLMIDNKEYFNANRIKSKPLTALNIPLNSIRFNFNNIPGTKFCRLHKSLTFFHKIFKWFSQIRSKSWTEDQMQEGIFYWKNLRGQEFDWANLELVITIERGCDPNQRNRNKTNMMLTCASTMICGCFLLWSCNARTRRCFTIALDPLIYSSMFRWWFAVLHLPNTLIKRLACLSYWVPLAFLSW
jgi:hypothetical protein